jgi:tetratricopeptide (TPR) repeat protein
LAALWAARNPQSPRAQASAALQLIQSGRYDQAAALLRNGMRKTPGEVQLAFNYVNARCAGTGLSTEDRQLVTTTISQAKNGQLLIHQWLSHALEIGKEGSCAGLDLDAGGRWINAAIVNPALTAAGRNVEDFEPLLGELAVHRNQPEQALFHFEHALRAHPGPDFAARMIAFLAEHGDYSQALSLLDTYEKLPSREYSGINMGRLHALMLEKDGYWPREFFVLRSELNAEIAVQAKRGTKQ